MNSEAQAIEIIKEIISMDDKILEESFEQLSQLFNMESSIEQALIEKIAYCRANNLTEDDLIQENNETLSSVLNQFDDLSEIKKKLFLEIFNNSIKINEKIIEKGLFSKVKVRVEKLSNDIELPSYAHENGDSGLDIKITEDIILEGGKTVIAKTGLKVAIPLGYEIQIRPRSGNSINYQNLFIANSPGTIDANYREELGIILKNIGDYPILITKGTKIAQAVLCPVIKLQWVEVSDINDFPTERNGGFGSTGA